MQTNKVFVYDPDPMIVRLIQGSILGIEPSTQVFAVSQIDQVLDSLQNTGPYPLLILDQDGLMDLGREIDLILQTFNQPFQIILTTYLFESEQKSNYPIPPDFILQKPLDGSLMNQMFEKVLVHPHQANLQSLSLSEDQYRQTDKILKKLAKETNCRCAWLCDVGGHVLVKVGDAEGVDPDEMASLMGGGFATLDEAGKSIDPEGLISLSYREGAKTDLYSINVRGNILLVLIVDKGMFYSRLGTVWYYTRQCAFDLNEVVTQGTKKTSPLVMDSSASDAYSSEIDKLFNVDL